MPPLLIKEDMDAMDSGDKSDHNLISMDMLADICDGSHTHSTLIGEKHVIKYAIVLSKDNCNGK